MKRFLLTGAASAIGRAIQQDLEKEGHLVLATDLNDSAANPVWFQKADLTSTDDLDRLIAAVKAEPAPLNGFVHVAMAMHGGLCSCTYKQFTDAYAVGTAAPFYFIQKLADKLAANASIVLIGSTRQSMSQPDTESYAAAKGGLAALTHALAMTLAGRARVNLIAPGWIQTGDPAAETAADRRSQPVGRIGRPEDVAAMCRFLLSDEAGFITGASFTVDGGMTKQMIYSGDFGWTFNPE